jgi:hypothetical protein
VAALDELMRDATAGDPMGELRWTHKSTRKLCRALRRRGYRVGRSVVRRLLRARRYSLRVNQKRLAGPHTPERDRQFRYIRRQQKTFVKHNWPVISVDTKKKELIGNFKNAGQAWTQQPQPVNVHDFPSAATGKALPYGIYDVGHNTGYVVVGVSSNTAAFAVEAIRSWWLAVGQYTYPAASRLLIQADCGGSNGNKSLLWKARLQALADECGPRITVTHYPAGASKWNAIEHRMFSLISQNWAGHPLVSYETLLKHIRSTRSETGFHCRARLDRRVYATGVKVSTEEAARLRVRYHKTFPQWNYTISPHPTSPHNK